MQDDISDGVAWLIAEGVADKDRVGIYGGSYGGFAVLSGLTKTPELYACGVDIVGPSSLFTFLETIPPYWEAMRPMLYKRVGHPERDEALLRERSPLFHANRIQAPLFIAQGANDPRVKRAESLQIVEALEQAGKTVDYLEFADEGHGFVRPENRLEFYRRAEAFLAEHLGGRQEG
jgi:dipeptidyl aminopeptidase/acylaminoacyl peptidase